MFGRFFQCFASQHVVRHLCRHLHRICQNLLTVTLEKRKHQATKETAQYTTQSVTVLKSASHKYGYLSAVLSVPLVVFLVEIASAVAAIDLSLHGRNVE